MRPTPERLALSGQFIFDDQTHFVRDDYTFEGLTGLAQYAAANWYPDLKKEPIGMGLDRYKFENYVKEIFFDSDTKIALLSGAPFDDPAKWFLSNDQIKQGAENVNAVAGWEAAAVPFAIYAAATRLDGRGRPGHRSGQANQLEGLHDRRSAIPADHEVSVPARR